MIKEYKISENVLELEDLMVNYLYGKGDYPPKVREALDNLNNAILDTYSEQTIEDYAMDDIIDYYVEVLPNGKAIKNEVDLHILMLNNFIDNYFDNKYGYYPEDIGEAIEKLHKTVLKHLKFSGDIDYFYILREIKYVKEGVDDGSKDK